jgi:hypothetical protein
MNVKSPFVIAGVFAWFCHADYILRREVVYNEIGCKVEMRNAYDRHGKWIGDWNTARRMYPNSPFGSMGRV